MRAHLSDIDFDAAAAEEARTRHDVMAHVRVFGAGGARRRAGIIHWGATSAYVTDNADLIQMREGLALIERRLVSRLLRKLRRLRPRPPGPPRPRLHALSAGPADDRRQARGALGLGLPDGPRGGPRGRARASASSGRRARRERRRPSSRSSTAIRRRSRSSTRALARRAGFERRQRVSGQTYSRKQDDLVVHALSGRRPVRPQDRRPTCACSSTTARSRSRSRRRRSAPRPCPTSATRCGRSGSARWRATSSRSRSTPR